MFFCFPDRDVEIEKATREELIEIVKYLVWEINTMREHRLQRLRLRRNVS